MHLLDLLIASVLVFLVPDTKDTQYLGASRAFSTPTSEDEAHPNLRSLPHPAAPYLLLSLATLEPESTENSGNHLDIRSSDLCRPCIQSESDSRLLHSHVCALRLRLARSGPLTRVVRSARMGRST